MESETEKIDIIISKLEIKKKELLALEMQADKLTLILDDLKTGVLHSLWLDEPAGDWIKFVPVLCAVLIIVNIIISIVVK